MALQYILGTSGLLCFLISKSYAQTTMHPTPASSFDIIQATASPLPPIDNHLEQDDSKLNELLVWLIVAWIPTSGFGVLLILLGFVILIFKKICKKKKQKTVLLEQLAEREQSGANETIKMESYLKQTKDVEEEVIYDNPTNTTDQNDYITDNIPTITTSPNSAYGFFSTADNSGGPEVIYDNDPPINPRLSTTIIANEMEESIYDNDSPIGPRRATMPAAGQVNHEEEDIYDNDSLISPRRATIPAAGQVNHEEKDIYDNDPPTNSRIPTRPRIESYGEIQHAAAVQDEGIYDNESPISPRRGTNPVNTLSGSHGEEDIYDNDPPTIRRESIYDNDPPTIRRESIYDNDPPTIRRESIYDNDPPTIRRESIYDNDPPTIRRESIYDNDPLSPMLTVSQNDDDNIYDN